MKKKCTLHFKIASVLVFLLFIASTKTMSQCLTSQLTINTGYNPATNGVYAIGTQDQYWSVTFNSTANQAVAAATPPYQSYVVTPNGAWAANATSQWLCFISNPNYTTTATTNDSAYYGTYTRHFKNCLADTFTFNLQYAADNWLSSIYVDGVSYFYQGVSSSTNQFNVFHTITAFSIYLTPGTHTIDANLFNYQASGTNPTGLNIIGTITGTQASLLTDTCTLSTGLSITPPADTLCAGANVSLTANGALTYSWSPATGLNTTSGATVIATPAATATYYVSGNICLGTSTDSVTIHVIPYASVNAGHDTSTCIHDSLQLKGITISPAGYTVKWSPSTYLSDSSILNPVVRNPVNSISYILTITNTYGNHSCASSDTMNLNVVPFLMLNAGDDTFVCIHNDLQLNASVAAASGTYNISWSPATFLNNNAIINPIMQNPLNTITYYVSVAPIASANCPSYDTLTVHVVPVPQVNVTDTFICFGNFILISVPVDTAFTYSWSPTTGLSNPNTIDPIIKPDATNTYILTGKGKNACIFYDTVTIHVWSNPVINVEADANSLSCQKQSIQLAASGAASYKWSPGVFFNDSSIASPIVAAFSEPTLFTVTGTDVNGCSSNASLQIDNNEKPVVFIPSAFTPNDDGLNDIVFLRVYCDFIMEHFEIYNRWGQMVFKAIDVQRGWDGKVNGVPAEMGVYYYIADGHSEQGKHVSLSGDITLIR